MLVRRDLVVGMFAMLLVGLPLCVELRQRLAPCGLPAPDEVWCSEPLDGVLPGSLSAPFGPMEMGGAFECHRPEPLWLCNGWRCFDATERPGRTWRGFVRQALPAVWP